MTNPKDIIFDDEAREHLQRGIRQACDAVRTTLGPKGRNICIAAGFGDPKITCDGHTILQEIELSNVFENMGVALAKEAASKMKEKCGDGTTTTTILLDYMVHMGGKFIAAGASPISLKRGMEKSLELLLKKLQEQSINIESEEQIQRVAQVSASGDESVGNLIQEAIKKVGREGVITIDEGKSTHTVLEIVEGLQFDRGFISPYFMTNPEKMIAEHDNPFVLITDRKIGSLHEIINLLQAVAASSRPLLIIAEDVETEALSTLVVNHLRGTLKIVAVKAPGFGDRRKALLEDLAIVTGAQVISEEKGLQLKDAGIEVLGNAQKVSINKDTTTIISGPGHEVELEKRVRQIDREIELASNKYDKEKLVERKAKLRGGVAVIRVGAPSEAALKNLKQKFEDSLNSTRAALESGIVIGAGMALAYNAKSIESLHLEGDEKLGAQVVMSACLTPAKQIIDNAGMDGSVLVNNLIKSAKVREGFNALHERIEDLIQVGVIDAAKIVMQTLVHAISSAGVVLLSEALLADSQDEE